MEARLETRHRPTMSRCIGKITACLCLVIATTASPVLHAEDVPLQFANPAQEARYQTLIKTLRCLVCQNQSLADSEADLAQDLRKIIHDRIVAGQSDAEIKQFLIARYGDFVLYRPPLQENTWLLWFGPFVLLILAAAVWLRIARRRTAPVQLDSEQAQKVQQLLGEGPPGTKSP